VRLPQSLACTRFLASKLAPELLGQNEWEELWCNIAADYLQDFYVEGDTHVADWFTQHEKWVKDVLQHAETYFRNLEDVFLSKGKRYLVSDTVSKILVETLLTTVSSLLGQIWPSL